MNVDYLRISITDKCNLRCIYCHPSDDCDVIENKEVLRFEEIHRIVRLFVECGIRKIRLTGGEPLVRKNIVHLVRGLAGIKGVEELALTTNGVLLEPVAAQLKAAGLKQVNVSVDSAERKNYKQITGFDFLSRVRRGICRAIEAGLAPVKINSVIIRGINESQIPALARMSISLPVMVRFIEYCPTSKYTKLARDYVSSAEVRAILERKFGLLSDILVDGANGPALYLRIRDSAGIIGFISGRSSTFCHRCNRLRLTSDGKIRPCLYTAYYDDVTKLIRSGAGDQHVRDLFKTIAAEKSHYTRLNPPLEEFSMQSIGG